MLKEWVKKLAKAAGPDLIRELLTDSFVRALKDSEAEVRTAASSQVPGFCSLIEQAVVLTKVLPCIKELVTHQ